MIKKRIDSWMLLFDGDNIIQAKFDLVSTSDKVKSEEMLSLLVQSETP
jgi:hypothetical protein